VLILEQTEKNCHRQRLAYSAAASVMKKKKFYNIDFLVSETTFIRIHFSVSLRQHFVSFHQLFLGFQNPPTFTQRQKVALSRHHFCGPSCPR